MRSAGVAAGHELHMTAPGARTMVACKIPAGRRLRDAPESPPGAQPVPTPVPPR
jgi:hypothetical protein